MNRDILFGLAMLIAAAVLAAYGQLYLRRGWESFRQSSLPDRAHVSIQQQSGGPNSPNTAVVGSGNVVTVNPLPAERTIDDAAATRIVTQIAPFRGQRVSVSAAMDREAQRLGVRIRALVIAAGWDCPSLVGQATFDYQPSLPGIRVEASPGTDGAARALAEALSSSASTGLRLDSGWPEAGAIAINVFPNPRP